MRVHVLSLSLLLLSGCTAPLFYAHDRALEDRLKNAQQQFADVSTGQASIWSTMQSNLDSAARRESEALRRDAANQRAATIAALDGLSWTKVESDAKLVSKKATDTLEDLTASIPATIDELDRLRIEIKNVPGARQIASHANGRKRTLPKDINDVMSYVAMSERFVAVVRNDVGPLLEGGQQASVRKLLAVAHKAKDPSLVKTIPELIDTATSAFKDPKTVQLPKDLQDAAKRYLTEDFTTFGELLDFFTAKDATGLDVALALAADFERTLLEIRRAKLEFLEERLRMLNAQLIVEQVRRVAADQVSAKAAGEEGEVKISLGKWFGAGDDAFRAGLPDLVAYIQLQGSLNSWSRMTANDIMMLDHRKRVRLDEIATAANARLATLGFQCITSFAEGGITEEQVANWLRALQTIGIAVIGAGSN